MESLSQYNAETPASVLLADAPVFAALTDAQKKALAFMAQTDERNGVGEYTSVDTPEGHATPLDIAKENRVALLACIALGLDAAPNASTYTLPEQAQKIADMLTAAGADLSPWKLGTFNDETLKLFNYGTHQALFVSVACMAHKTASGEAELAIERATYATPTMEPESLGEEVLPVWHAAQQINGTNWARKPFFTA